MTENTDLAYLAGIIDGEGYVGITSEWRVGRRTCNPRAKVESGMKNHPLIADLARKYGGTLYAQKTNGCSRVSWRNSRAADLLSRCLPWLRIKLPLAALVIEFDARRLADYVGGNRRDKHSSSFRVWADRAIAESKRLIAAQYRSN